VQQSTKRLDSLPFESDTMYTEVFKDVILISKDFSFIIQNLDRNTFGTYTFALISSCGSAYATSNIILEG